MKDENDILINTDEYWIRFGKAEQSSSFTGNLGGKYLFFSNSQQQLIDIAKYEISIHDFEIAKVSVDANKNDYVLCLYYINDKRKYELAERYKQSDVRYRYWKLNKTTRLGIYSEEYK